MEIFNKKVKDCDKLLKMNLKEDITFSTMISLIESAPEGMHESLMLKFTFMFGLHRGLTRDQIQREVRK